MNLKDPNLRWGKNGDAKAKGKALGKRGGSGELGDRREKKGHLKPLKGIRGK